MDAYLSLVNLNFMSSLRTGNLVVDIILAMLIPVIMSAVMSIFREKWPQLVTRFLQYWKRTPLQALVEETGCNNPENENEVLKQAVTLYVTKQVKPDYQTGDLVFSRLPIPSSQKVSVGQLLKDFYCINTLPSEYQDVVINKKNGLTMRICKDEKENEENEREEPDRGKKATDTKEALPYIKLTCTPSHFQKEDDIQKFVVDAYEWYKTVAMIKNKQSRYLYQPLIKEAPLTVLPDTNTAPEEITCQRYELLENKTFRSLFFPQKQELIELLDKFEKREGKFAVPGYPHKLVLLLYGPPGTGKTSLVKAVAAHTGRDIFSIPLSRVSSNRMLLSLMYDGTCKVEKIGNNGGSVTQKLVSDKVVYVLEDVDAASDIAKKKETAPQVHLEEREKQEEGEEEEEREAVSEGKKEEEKEGEGESENAVKKQDSKPEEGKTEEDKESEKEEGERTMGDPTTTKRTRTTKTTRINQRKPRRKRLKWRP